MISTYEKAMEEGKVEEFIEGLDKQATAIVDASQTQNPAKEERDRLLNELQAGAEKDVWAKGQKKQIESMRAQFKQMKFRAQALIDKTTTALLRAAQTIPTIDRTKNMLLLKELVADTREKTNKKRANTARKTGRLSDDQKTSMRNKMLDGNSFTLPDFVKSSGLGFNPSRSQADAILKPLIKSGQLKASASGSGKAPKYSASN